MNRRLALLVAVALTAVAVPAVVAAPKPDQKLSIQAAPSTVKFGNEVKVTGQLTGGTARDISGQNVTLQQDAHPYEGKFERVANVDTNDAGAYSFTVKPQSNSKYRVTKGKVQSADALVVVRVAVTRAVSDTTPKKGSQVTFSGTVTPAHDAKRVKIQRKTSSGWRTIAKAVLANGTDGVSDYSHSVKITKSGRYRVRMTPADGDHVSGNSPGIKLAVG